MVRLGRDLGALAVALVLAPSAVVLALDAQPPAPLADSGPAPLAADRADPVASYTLSARLDDANHSVHGEGTLVWRNSSRASTDELYFHLYLNAFENAHTLFNRSPFTRARSGRSTRRWGHVTLSRLVARELGDADLLPRLEPHTPGDPLDATDRRLQLPRAVAPGETLTIELAWEAVLPDIVERTGVARDFHFVGQWFPKIARLDPDGTWVHFPFHPHAEFYADFGDYDVTLDVPEAMVVGATGRRVSESVEAGRRRLHQRAESVHDFAWTAWPGFERREERIGDVDVHLLYPPGNDANAERTLGALRFTLPFFDAAYGKYPYPDLTVVHPPAFATSAGGMEYPTLITTGGAWHQAYWSRATELVTIHELGHQWFYGLIATNEPRWPFLDEGLNSYAETLASEGLFGPSSASDLLGLELSATALHRAGMSFGEHDAALAQPAADFVDFSELGGLVYSRTALLFRTLGNVYGRDRLARAFARYAERFRFQHPSPDDLLQVLGEELGSEAVENARGALFEGHGVNYSVRDVRSVRRREPADSARPDAPSAGGAPAASAAGGYESRIVIHRNGE
ncbi:MAG TPA: M1 family metallopeptidase, partial [Polyangiaceae bacterium]|nr:M1 family metallopeptidase [Polyangiaceae bacterium]